MTEKKKLIYYLTPVLLAVIILASNFLETDLFEFGEKNFAVWFVVSVFSFACGWFINKTLNWNFGGKIVFAVIVASTFVSLLMVSFFHDYFLANELLSENLILFGLRNIMLGAMAFFGMAVVELLRLQKELMLSEQKLKSHEEFLVDAKKEAELELREAKLKAEKLLNDAELTAKNIMLKKERIERELKEFIQIERELIRRYEEQS